jgi:hypothetical protein
MVIIISAAGLLGSRSAGQLFPLLLPPLPLSAFLKGHGDEVGLDGVLDDLAEALADAHVVLGGGLDVVDLVGFGEGEDFVSGDLCVEVALAADEVDGALDVEVLEFLQPVGEVDEGRAVVEGEAQADGVGVCIGGGVLL